MTITCVITDDEPMARKGLQSYVERVDFLSLTGVCEDAIQLNTLLKTQQPDLLLLDIEMPYLSGLDLLATLNQPPKVIVTSAYEQYALKGYNDEDIIKAVQTIEEIQGGYALVSEGKVLGTLPLTVAGLLSQKPAKDIQKGIDELLQKAWKLGISRDIDPFITLSFMALPVIPSLRLTDLGLVDVDTFQLLKS